MISSSDFSGYTRTFTKDGRGMTGAQHGMCELARYGTARTPHGTCGLVFSLNSAVIVRMLHGRIEASSYSKREARDVDKHSITDIGKRTVL
jgi:hypothetical protein